MLQITVPATECWDDKKQEFISIKEQTLQLEHSLVSLSKWESKWCKPFLHTDNKTDEEVLDYIKCMTITQNIDESIYDRLTSSNIEAVMDYISAPMTATWFSNEKKPGVSREKTTSELIYYWMTALNIPMECQKWHLNRLLTLIRIAGEKNQPPKKMNKNDILKQNRALNARRKAKYKTRG